MVFDRYRLQGKVSLQLHTTEPMASQLWQGGALHDPGIVRRCEVHEVTLSPAAICFLPFHHCQEMNWFIHVVTPSRFISGWNVNFITAITLETREETKRKTKF